MREFGEEEPPAKKPSGCLKYLLYVVRGTFTAIVAAFVFLPFLGAAFLAGISQAPEPGWEKTVLPEKIGFSKVLLSHAERGGFLEGCVFVAYQLSPDTIHLMEKEGASFFKDVGQPPKQHKNPYAPWKNTPIEEQPYIFADGALYGCNNDNSVQNALGRIDFHHEEGNFYTITENREGIIVVMPKRQLAIYAYFG